MAESFPDPDPGAPRVPSRYRVHRLADAKATERGVVYRRGGRRFLLSWDRVQRALAARIGGPEAAGAAVIDLAVAVEGPEAVACRVEAALGEPTRAFARAVEVALGAERCCASLLAAARDGRPSRLHADQETFSEAALESIRFL